MIPEEAAKLIGKTDAPVIYEVSRGSINQYIDAISDRNPLYWKEEYALNSRYGSVIAPPGYSGWPVRWGDAGPYDMSDSAVSKALAAMAKVGYPYMLDGGADFEFILPIRAGEILVNSCKLIDIQERESKGTHMFFIIWENTYTNQNGAAALKLRQTLICR